MEYLLGVSVLLASGWAAWWVLRVGPQPDEKPTGPYADRSPSESDLDFDTRTATGPEDDPWPSNYDATGRRLPHWQAHLDAMPS
jgi:hypothetical protein